MRVFPGDEEQSAREPFRRLSVDEAKELIDADRVCVIDVREPAEYKGGHIAGARLVPLQQLLRQPQEHLASDNLIFVCAVGERSAVACEMAAALGFGHVYNMEGGMKAWVARGYAVEKA